MDTKHGIDRGLEDAANALLRGADDVKMSDDWHRKVTGLEDKFMDHMALIQPDRRHSKSYANPSDEVERQNVMRH